MTCKITFTIENKKIKTEVSIGKSKKEARFFSNFIAMLQNGEYNETRVKAIVKDSRNNDNVQIGKDVVRNLIKANDILNQPIILPEEVGQDEEFGNGIEE